VQWIELVPDFLLGLAGDLAADARAVEAVAERYRSDLPAARGI
jgi:hypothetical protein